jgi:hypothetical protein
MLVERSGRWPDRSPSPGCPRLHAWPAVSGSATSFQQSEQMPWLNRANEWAAMYVPTR